MVRTRLLALLLSASLLTACTSASKKDSAPRSTSAGSTAAEQKTATPDSPATQPALPSGQPGYASGQAANNATSKPSAARDAAAETPRGYTPPSDMYYQDHGVNPVVSAAQQPVSTFAIDVDTASYTLVRSHLDRSMLPPPEAIRAEELINYFPQSYPAPRDRAVAVHAEAAPSPFRNSMQVVQVGLKAKEVSRLERKPVVLTFVIDVSGSMDMENRLGLVKESLRLLVDQLRNGDQVGIVTYGSTAQVVLEHTGDRYSILSAIERLRPSGSTNAEQGLLLGYDLAYRAYRGEATNRIILCSDGVANVGATGPEAMLRRVEDYRTKGITLTTLGFGMGNYNDNLMEQLADKGDGKYGYIDDLEEARRMFVDDLTGTLELVARDVKVQVRFDPAEVSTWRLVGYENRVMANQDFRNNAKDAGELGAGDTVTALYEVQLKNPQANTLGRVAVRYRDPNSGAIIELDEPIHLTARRPADASARLRWSAAVAEFAGVMKGSPWSGETTLKDVLSIGQKAAADLGYPREHMEFLGLVEKAMRLGKR